MRYIFAGLTEAMVFCVGICGFAQDAAPSTNRQPNARSQPSEMVISGCLRSFRSDGGETTIYTLEGRKPTTNSYPPNSSAVPEDATAPHATPITPANTVYSLSASALVNLNEHVGQKVELTGTMQPPAWELGAVGTTGTLGGAQAQGEVASPANSRFAVSAVKMLSIRCE
jgi:hypothetical protein